MRKSLSATEAVKLRALLASGRAAQLRRDSGLSKAALARGAGVTESAILRWENGERRPTGLYAATYYRTLARLERAAGRNGVPGDLSPVESCEGTDAA